MKKIYILTAVLALLTLSLNAQQAKKNVAKVVASTEKVVTPLGGAKKAIKPTGFRAPNRANRETVTVVSNDFSNASWWTIYDANNDNSKWAISNGYATYTYHSTNAANDWLVSSSIALEAGKTYTFKLDSWIRSTQYPEKLEVKFASGNSLSAISAGTTVIQETTILTASQSSPTQLRNTFTVPSSGNYYIGIHATSDADKWELYVDNMIIQTDDSSSGDDTNTLTVCGGDYFIDYLPVYGYRYDVAQHNQMVYPASMLSAMAGKTVKSMTFYPTGGYVDSNNNGQYDSGETTYQGLNFYGSSVTFKLMNLSSGTSAFADENPTLITGTMTAVKTLTPQQNTSATTWVISFDQDFTYTGGDLLIDMTNTAGNYGRTAFSCDVVDTNQGAVTYSTSQGDVAAGLPILPKVTFTYEDSGTPSVMISPETQTINDAAAGTLTITGANLEGNINVSAANTTDWSVNPTSFTNAGGDASVSYTGRALSASTTVTATAANDNTVTDEATVNYVADLYIVTDNGQQGNWIFTDGTHMTNNDGIYTATFTADVANTFILFARKLGNDVYWGTRYVFGPTSDGDWWLPVDGNGNGTLDLYSDHPIKIQTAGTYTITINANDGTFTITRLLPDLAISLSAPASVVGGNTATVTATVTNNGDAPATGYTVTITADGNTILTQTVNETLAAGASATFTADYLTTEAQVGSTVSFAANVACTDDGDATNNNASASTSVITLPPPENVVATGDSEHQSATVTWDVPSNLPTELTEYTWDFEEQSQFNEWTLVNNDNDSYNWQYRTYVEGESADVFEPHSGTGYIVSPSFVNNVGALNPDNWLISPEITLGGTFTFWAKGTDATYFAENFGVFVYQGSYSSGISGFQQVDVDKTATSGWLQYTFDLSQYSGIGRIAIRHYDCTDQYWLEVDDINYEVNVPIQPVSYNIYLDGELVGNVPSTDPLSYDFGNVGAGEHTCAVSAVYPGNIESAQVPATFTLQAKTPTPTITHTETPAGVVITATGEGHVTLVVDGITYEGEGSVSATVVRSPEEREVTATATAQASGALPSDEAEEDILIPALASDPTTMATGLLRLHLLMVDQMIEDIPDDNTHPDRYNYVLRYEPNGPTGSGVKESSTVHVDIQKADCEVTGYYSLKQIDGDTIIGLDHKQGITMDVVTADVAYNLSSTNTMLYEYLLQGAKNRVPEYQQDYLTKLRQSQNFTYFEMLEGPDKGHEYPNGEHHYLGALELGTYGSTFMSYAPSVSTDGIQRRYYEDDGFDNTYGAPIWKTAVGEVKMSEEEAPIAERQTNQWNSVNWTDRDAQGNDAPASLFILDNIWATAKLPHTQIATVKYEPYMFRVFVQSNNGLLRPYKVVPQGEGQYDGEHLDAVDRDLTEADVKGPKCVWSGYLQFDEDGEVIGDLPNGVEVQLGTDDGGQKTFTYHKSKVDRQGGSSATLPQPSEWDKDANNAMFGALDALAISGYDAQGKPILRNDITEDDLKIFVRFYYVVKGMADGWTPGTRGQGDDPAGYGSESGSSSPGIATSVNEIRYHGEAVETIYYNVQGMSSDRPFEGVNLVVTRYSDGATVVSKVVK